jgi:hypothetical protein
MLPVRSSRFPPKSVYAWLRRVGREKSADHRLCFDPQPLELASKPVGDVAAQDNFARRVCGDLFNSGARSPFITVGTAVIEVNDVTVKVTELQSEEMIHNVSKL